MQSLKPPDHTPACVGGIELAIFGAERNAGAPVIFVTHGRGGAMAHVFGRCRDLVADGFVAVALEQRNHGRRLVDPRCNDGWGPETAANTYSILLGMAMDIRLLIDMLPACTGIATACCGMTGFSLGGHATLLAMAVEPRISVGVSFIGTGDHRGLMALRAAQNHVPPEQFGDYFPPALDAVVRSCDPIHNPGIFSGRPLLLLNGGTDTVVPIACVRRFHAAVKRACHDPRRLRLSVYRGVGHEVTPAMWDEGRKWFRRWLREP